MKNATGVDTSKFAKMVHLVSLKTEVHRLDIDKLEKVPTCLNNLKNKICWLKLDVNKLVPVPVGLSKLSDVVKNDVFKEDVYNPKIKDIKDKISDITNIATTTTLNAKINEVKYEIPSTTNLVTNTALNAKINELEKNT